jgi:hypothetical protein
MKCDRINFDSGISNLPSYYITRSFMWEEVNHLTETMFVYKFIDENVACNSYLCLFIYKILPH